MYAEDDLIPLSALQHLLFCERRAALIYIEGAWEDNPFTIEGGILHERTHASETESRGDIRIVRGLPLRSLRLGVTGKADVVEFHRLTESHIMARDGEFFAEGTTLEGVPGLWQPFPVEYKRGSLRREEGYEVQLCAQALCLEEMLGVTIPVGALYYGKSVRRLELAFDKELRKKTEVASERLHELVARACTPKAYYSKKCEKCSLIDVCLPKATSRKRSVNSYLSRLILESGEEDETAS
ncbi:MAG: CRISPR-associated protein Cas4 [Actinobacteria bacterium]|nr:CRISPR-associated protein Cas4 [Actinomycetota bacterium]